MIKKFVKCKYVKWQIRFKEVQIYIERVCQESHKEISSLRNRNKDDNLRVFVLQRTHGSETP